MRQVVVSDLSGFRLELAARPGDVTPVSGALDATREALLAVAEGGYELVADTTGNPAVFAQALSLLAPFEPYLASVVERAGRLDVLVNNAGVLPVGAFEDQSEADLRAVMEANFFGPALLTRAALPIMRGQLGGYVIMVSSLSGIAGKAGDSPYTASKFALEGLTESLRHEVARWNIKTAPVGRVGTTRDVVHATLFFLSPRRAS